MLEQPCIDGGGGGFVSKNFQIHNSFYTVTLSFRHIAHCSVYELSTLFLT